MNTTILTLVTLTTLVASPEVPNPTPKAAPAHSATIDSPVLTPEGQWKAVNATVRIAFGENAGPVATGVCVGVKGGYAYILTANHTVPKGEGRTFEFFSKETYPKASNLIVGSEILFRLPDCDIALVKLQVGGEEVPWIQLAGPGQRPKKYPYQAVAVGCPGGEPAKVRAVKIVARKLVRKPDETIAFFWEADQAPIGGMSGGPLIDSNGRVIGICTASQDGRGYYTHLDEILAGLKRNGYGWLATPQVTEP